MVDFQIATDKKYKPNWHHEIIGEELEHIAEHGARDYDILIIEVPPRHGKSRQVSIDFPAWYLGKYSEKEIITSSYSGDLATDFGRKTREKIKSPLYQKIFDLKLAEDSKSKSLWHTADGGSYTSVGIGGPITGRGADVLIVDDPIKNREEARSIVIKDKHWDWFTSTAYTRLEPNGVVVVMATRWAVDDLTGRILKNKSFRVKRINFPAIAMVDEYCRKRGDALWISKYPIEELEKKKQNIGSYDWASLYQQTPVASENQKFKEDWFKYRQMSEVEQMTTYNVLTIDPRGVNDIKRGTDFVGLALNFVDSEGKWNLISSRRKLSGRQLVDLMFSWWTKHNLNKIGIEDNQFTQGLMTTIEEEIKKRGVYLDIVLLKHHGSQKELRIESLAPRYEYSSIYHIKNGETNMCIDLEEELLLFPEAPNDDSSDATAYQNELADKPAGDLHEDWGLYNESFT